MTRNALLKNGAQVWGVELPFICKTEIRQTYQHTVQKLIPFEMIRNNDNQSNDSKYNINKKQ